MILSLMIGGIIGGVIGGVVGYVGKCAGGSCPLVCHPIGGILFGAFTGIWLATSVHQGKEPKMRPPENPPNAEWPASKDLDSGHKP